MPYHNTGYQLSHFDHVRLGDDGSLVFSIENGRDKTGRRAITILLNSDSGDWYGIKTSGYESLKKLAKRPLLWVGSESNTPSANAAFAPVTSFDDQQGGGQRGIASGQSGLSDSKDTENSGTVQDSTLKNTISKEIDAIREKSLADGTFMKAPNGNDSNLVDNALS